MQTTTRRVVTIAFVLGMRISLAAESIVLVAGGTRDAVGIAATDAKLKEPFGTGFDAHGGLFIVEMSAGNRLLAVDAGGILTHIAGSGESGDRGDGGPSLRAQLNGPHSLAVLPDGSVLVADTWNGRVRRVETQTRTITSLPGFIVPPAQARGSGPYCITLDFSGAKLYVADLKRVHVIDLKSGESKILAGNGERGVPQDGATAVDAPLVDPRAAAADRSGRVYVLERGGNALRAVESSGKIRTVVNASGAKGNSGDGGPALQATMNGPKHLCVDMEDNVLIADAENHVVRKYLAREGRIIRIAGTGTMGSAGVGGDPLRCDLNRPHGVAVHPKTAEVYITDSYNHRVLKIAR